MVKINRYFAACSTLFLFLEQIGVRKLEAFLGTLIAVMAIAFARLFIEARPGLVGIAKGRGKQKLSPTFQSF